MIAPFVFRIVVLWIVMVLLVYGLRLYGLGSRLGLALALALGLRLRVTFKSLFLSRQDMHLVCTYSRDRFQFLR